MEPRQKQQNHHSMLHWTKQKIKQKQTNKQLDGNPSCNVITLGDLNATISPHSKSSGAWNKILGNTIFLC